MDIKLTKDADFMIATVYQEYCRRIKGGMPMRQARLFNDIQFLRSELFPTWPVHDILEVASELSRAGLVRKYLRSGFLIVDAGIVYAEERFKSRALSAIDVLSKLKP